MDHNQKREFYEALLSAFAVPGSLTRMLIYRFGLPPWDIPNNPDFRMVVHPVLEEAEMRGHEMKLLAAALDANRTNPKLLAFAQQFGLTALTPALERQVDGLPG